MSNLPDGQKPTQSHTGWWVAAAALFVGYLLGQANGSTAVTNTASPADYPATVGSQPAALDLNSAGVASPLAGVDDQPSAEPADTDASDETADDAADASSSDDADASDAPQIANSGADEETQGSPTTVASTGDDSIATPAATNDRSALNGYAPSNASTVASTGPACSESGSCYGDTSTITGLPKTTYVHGYYRKNGTYVRSYYRSHH